MNLICKNCGGLIKRTETTSCPLCGTRIIDDGSAGVGDGLSFMSSDESQAISMTAFPESSKDAETWDNGLAFCAPHAVGPHVKAYQKYASICTLDGDKAGEISLVNSGVQFLSRDVCIRLFYHSISAVTVFKPNRLYIAMKDGKDYEFKVDFPKPWADNIKARI